MTSTRSLWTAYWPGIVLAPVIFLAELALAYALVPWACARQQHGVLHITSGVTLAVMLVVLAFAWRDWRRVKVPTSSRSDALHARGTFLALLAVLGTALFTLATLALWFMMLVVPPCVA